MLACLPLSKKEARRFSFNQFKAIFVQANARAYCVETGHAGSCTRNDMENFPSN